jgi:hypothetical protein
VLGQTVRPEVSLCLRNYEEARENDLLIRNTTYQFIVPAEAEEEYTLNYLLEHFQLSSYNFEWLQTFLRNDGLF